MFPGIREFGLVSPGRIRLALYRDFGYKPPILNESMKRTSHAAKLESGRHNDGDLHCHLQRAGIDAAGAETITTALKSLPDEQRSSLVSVSLSYNDALGDTGTIALAQGLPSSLRELGLVGCGAGDAGGEALLQWAGQAPRLRTLCIEDNLFSEGARSRFTRLAQAGRGCCW